MKRDKKGIVYLKQRGVDVDRSRAQLNGHTYDKLKETFRRVCPERKLPPEGKAGIIDALIVEVHQSYFTPKQKQRLAKST